MDDPASADSRSSQYPQSYHHSGEPAASGRFAERPSSRICAEDRHQVLRFVFHSYSTLPPHLFSFQRSATSIFGNPEGVTLQGLQVISFATQILVDYGSKGASGSVFVLSVVAAAEELLNNLLANSGRASVPTELCCLCDGPVLFNASHPYASQCSQCEFTIDRCCVTLQLIVYVDAAEAAAAVIPSSSSSSADENRFYRCPSCGSVANRAGVDKLVSHTRSLQLPRDLCPRDAFPWSRISCAICPFCSVLMTRI